MVSGLSQTIGSIKKSGTYERRIIRSGVVEADEPQMTRKDTSIPAIKTAVRSIDFVGGGSVTIKGSGAYGGGGDISVSGSGISQQQAEQIATKKLGYTKEQIKPPEPTLQELSKQPQQLQTLKPITQLGKVKQLFSFGRGSYLGVSPEIKTFYKAETDLLIPFEQRKAEEGKGVYAIKKAREEKEAQERIRLETEYQQTKLEGETKSEYLRRTQKGGGITQKYYELWGVKFYAKGEREALVAEGLKSFTEAETYEQQQEALKKLQTQGVEIKEVGEEYVIEKEQIIQTLAPTSKLGNVLVGVTDIMLKTKIFKPYLTTGAAKKTEQEVVYRRRFETPEDVKREQAKALIKKYEDIYAKKGRVELEKELVKTWKELETPEAKEGFKSLIEELVRKDIIRVPVYKVPTVRSIFSETQLTFDIQTFPAGIPPQLEKVGDVITLSSLYKQKGKEKQITTPIQKEKQKEEQKQKPITIQQLQQKQKPIQSSIILQKVIQKQIPQQKITLKQLQKPIQKQPPTPRIPIQLITPRLLIPKIFLYKFKKEKDIYKQNLQKLKRDIKKTQSKYTASLGASFFQKKPTKVTRKEYERLSKRKYSGIETRPVLQIVPEEESKKKIKKVQF